MNTDVLIGIKQVVRLEWMQKTAELIQSGMSKKDIRAELDSYLSDKRGNGAVMNRSEYTKSIVVSLLTHTWINPQESLLPLRDATLSYLQNNPDDGLPCHWLMYGATYPFWFSLCRILGSLFSLENPIPKKQVMSQVYERYGKRSTIERCSRYVIRTLIAWGILRDRERIGIYEKMEPKPIDSPYLGSLLLESVLQGIPEKKSSLPGLTEDPAFFPFRLPPLTGAGLTGENQRIILEPGLHEEQILLASTPV